MLTRILFKYSNKDQDQVINIDIDQSKTRSILSIQLRSRSDS